MATANKSWDKKVKGLNEAWGNAQTAAKESRGFTNDIEDGKYFARLVGAEVGESQTSQRVQISWQYAIAEGEHQGKLLRDYDGLETEQNLTFVLRKLDTLGYDIEDMNAKDLEDVLADIVKSRPLVRIRVKTKGEYQNIYLDQLIEGGAGGGEEEEPEVEEELDEPEVEEEEEVIEEEETGWSADDACLVLIQGKQRLGKVVEVVGDDLARVFVEEMGKTFKVPLAKLESVAEEETGEAAVEVGAKVAWQYRDSTLTGVVKKMLDDDAVHITRDDTGKTTKVAIADLTVLDE